MRSLVIVSLLSAAALAGGCGSEAKPKEQAAASKAERGIYTSASDCAADGRLTGDQCGNAIDIAVSVHDEKAPVYQTLNHCAASEGPERCEKTFDGAYRPRLQAFFVVMGENPSAVPLYAPFKAEKGFRSPTKQSISAMDESLRVSVAAMTLANENARLEQGAAGGTYGSTAANIR